jgi:cation diffusion facilitator CzcD-associated flavoprotein CzcO
LEERKFFIENPKAYLEFRKKQEAYCNNVQKIFFKGSEAQNQFAKFLDANLKESTKEKPWLYEQLKPNYPPGCRRLIMGQAWLECLQKPNANLIPRDVVEFTEKGLIDSEGVETEYDAIICATGFDA